MDLEYVEDHHSTMDETRTLYEHAQQLLSEGLTAQAALEQLRAETVPVRLLNTNPPEILIGTRSVRWKMNR